MLLGLVQLIIDCLAGLLSVIVAILPTSPFTFISDYALSNDIVGAINYFLPISDIIAVLELWCTAIVVYYGWMIFARWVKLLD